MEVIFVTTFSGVPFYFLSQSLTFWVCMSFRSVLYSCPPCCHTEVWESDSVPAGGVLPSERAFLRKCDGGIPAVEPLSREVSPVHWGPGTPGSSTVLHAQVTVHGLIQYWLDILGQKFQQGLLKPLELCAGVRVYKFECVCVYEHSCIFCRQGEALSGSCRRRTTLTVMWLE